MYARVNKLCRATLRPRLKQNPYGLFEKTRMATSGKPKEEERLGKGKRPSRRTRLVTDPYKKASRTQSDDIRMESLFLEAYINVLLRYLSAHNCQRHNTQQLIRSNSLSSQSAFRKNHEANSNVNKRQNGPNG